MARLHIGEETEGGRGGKEKKCAQRNSETETK